MNSNFSQSLFVNKTQEGKMVQAQTLEELIKQSILYKYDIKTSSPSIDSVVYLEDAVFASFPFEYKKSTYVGYIHAQKSNHSDLLMEDIELFEFDSNVPFYLIHTLAKQGAKTLFIETGSINDDTIDSIEFHYPESVSIIKTRDHRKTFLTIENERPVEVDAKRNDKIVYTYHLNVIP